MSLTDDDKKYIQELVEQSGRTVVDDIIANLNIFIQQTDGRFQPLEWNREDTSKWKRQTEKVLEQHAKKWQKVAKAAQS